jgi:hypothetical protein
MFRLQLLDPLGFPRRALLRIRVNATQSVTIASFVELEGRRTTTYRCAPEGCVRMPRWSALCAARNEIRAPGFFSDLGADNVEITSGLS